MASTLLEQGRQYHDDIERAERLVAKDLKRSMTRYKDRLQQDHRVNRFIDDVQDKSRKLVSFWSCWRCKCFNVVKSHLHCCNTYFTYRSSSMKMMKE